MTEKIVDSLRAAAVALSLAGAAIGCGRDASIGPVASSDVGSIGFNLTLPNGAHLTKLTFTISGPTSKTGEIPLSGSGTTFSATIDGLEAGTGYAIELEGTQSNGAKNCTGKADFEVNARETTTVKVRLFCPGIRKAGSILVNGTVNVCAVVESATSAVSGDTRPCRASRVTLTVDRMPFPMCGRRLRAANWQLAPMP